MRNRLLFLWLCILVYKETCNAVVFQHNIAHTKYGSLRGTSRQIDQTTVHEFLRIPYAKPPTGALRFRKPEAPSHWQGVRDASTYGPVCTQKVTHSYRNIYPNHSTSEDCLFLNIYVPETVKTGKKAVLFYIHGGGFYLKSANLYDGSNLAAAGDVIVVLLNYRLGLFGFLSTADSAAKGNYGLWDQLAALNWVRENIANFGGDPSNVTIAGHSAGGYSIGLHLLSNHSRGLYNRAFMASGFGISPRSVSHKSREFAMAAASHLGCDVTSTTSLVNCLRSKSAADILSAQLNQVAKLSNNVSFYLLPGPVVDGEFLSDHPAELIKNPANGPFKDVSLMAGTNFADGWLLKSKLKHYESLYHYTLDSGVSTDAFCKGILPDISRDYFQSNQIITNRICQKYSNSSISPINQGLQAVNMYGDMMYAAPAVQTLRYKYHSKNGHKPWAYHFLFHHKPSFPVISSRADWVQGAQHGDECWFLFRMKNFQYSSQELHLLNHFGRYITNFVKYGNPNGVTNHAESKTLPHWPHFAQREYYLDININITVHGHLFADRMDFWLNQIPQLHSTYTVPTQSKIPYIFG